MVYVCRAVCDKLYIDAYILWRSQQGFDKMRGDFSWSFREQVAAMCPYRVKSDDDANRNSRANVQTGAIIHLPQSKYEHEQADAGRECRTRLARPNTQARTRIERYSFSLFSCMDAIRGPFAMNTINSAAYTSRCCFASSGHSVRDQING